MCNNYSFRKETPRVRNNEKTVDTLQVVSCIQYFINTQKHNLYIRGLSKKYPAM